MIARAAGKLMEALSAEGRTFFASRLVRHDFDAGRTLVSKGERVSGAYFVLSGQLRVYVTNPGGSETTLYLIEPGETCVLALNSLFNSVIYPAWVQTECPATVGVLPGAVFRTLFSREPAIQDLTVRALSTAAFRLMDELDHRHSERLDQRLARFLLLRAAPDGMVRKTQQEIADNVGSTREVVARLLGGFVARGIVSTGRGWVRVDDAPALVRIGDGANA